MFVKYAHPAKQGRDRRVKEKLGDGHVVRDTKGREDVRKIKEIDRAVEQLAHALLTGKLAVREEQHDQPLTLAEGFAKALDLTAGKYPTKTRRYEEVDRARKKLERVLGKQRLWTAIKPGDVRRIWRKLAADFKASGSDEPTCGPRQAEVTIDALYSVATWLREEELIPSDALLPMSKWRAKLKDEWQKLTGKAVEPKRLRYTEEEFGRLVTACHHPDVDPRFALAFDLGGEQRLGQVLRCWRSHLDVKPVVTSALADAEPGRLGQLIVQGNGHKAAAPVMLTPDQRRAVDAALAGYLSDYESLYRAGEIADYPLFPANRFRKGKAKVSASPQPLTRDAALKMFRELERVAGVETVKGRGWYGYRRAATDLAEDVEQDERVLNSITGHRDSTTRRLVYQDRERPEVLNKAAETRARLRERAAATARAADRGPATSSQSAASA